MRWPRGLDEEPSRAKPFYAVIAAAMLVGMLVKFLGVDPFVALFWTAVINGLAAPPLLFLILRLANDRKAMGSRTNGRLANTLGSHGGRRHDSGRGDMARPDGDGSGVTAQLVVRDHLFPSDLPSRSRLRRTNSTFAGRSASRRMKYGYHSAP